MIRLFILRILESYFRHRWLYLLPLLLLTGAGVAMAALETPKYRTTGVLYVEEDTLLSELSPVSDNGFGWIPPARVISDRVNELLNTDAFIRAVISQTDLENKMDGGPDAVDDTITEVRNAMYTRALGNNHLELVIVHEDREIAYQLGTAAMEAFVQWQINADLSQSVAAETFFEDIIQERAADVTTARDALSAYLVANPEPLRGDRPIVEELEIERLVSDLRAAEDRYEKALSSEEDAQLASQLAESAVRQTFFVIDAPERPRSPETSMRDIAMQLGIFVALGAIISGGMVLGGALLDRSMRFPIDVWHRLELDVLAVVPRQVDLAPAGAPQAAVAADEAPAADGWDVGGVVPTPAADAD